MIKAVEPTIKPIFVIFEPMAFPIAIDGFPLIAAMIDMIISGADVPKPTIIIPITRGDIPRFRANPAAPIMNRSAPQMRRQNPIIMATIVNSIKFLNPFYIICFNTE